MDLSSTIEPRSDQLNADDLIAAPVIVTITDVTKGNAEQPVNIVTAEYGNARPYKPGKSMRRVLVAAWGKDSTAYVGRRLRLYNDPEVTFGRDKTGGIRISHMSDISDTLTVALTVTRGKRKPFIVEPLAPERAWLREIESATTLDELHAIYSDGLPKQHWPTMTARKKQIEQESE